MATSTIIAPEAYPFRVLVGPLPLLARGGDIQVRATLAATRVSREGITEIDGFVDAFVMLATSGGLSGDAIPPPESSIADKRDVMVEGNVLLWDLLGCRVDERALLNLLNLFHFDNGRNPFATIEVYRATVPAHPLTVQVGAEDYFPAMYPPLFHLKVDHPIAESVTVTLRLGDVPDASQVEAFETELLSWSVAPSVGAFAVPGLDVEASGMIPEQSVEVFDTEIVWGIDRFRMHPAAIDSLINCCSAMSDRIATITAVDVS